MTADVRTPGNPRGMRDLPFPIPGAERKEKDRARRLMHALFEAYPDAECELDFSAPHELLIATILSAQSTDVGVNKATPGLFAAFPKPADYAASTPKEIEPHIKTIGLYRNKAKHIHGAMTLVVEKHGGEIPRTVDELLELPGVARKTAGVVLSEAFGINDAFVVDTHVHRLSARLGLIDKDETVAMTERRLMSLFPRDKWREVCHAMIWHGRRSCPARGNTGEHAICKGFGVGCSCRAGG